MGGSLVTLYAWLSPQSFHTIALTPYLLHHMILPNPYRAPNTSHTIPLTQYLSPQTSDTIPLNPYLPSHTNLPVPYRAPHTSHIIPLTPYLPRHTILPIPYRVPNTSHTIPLTPYCSPQPSDTIANTHYRSPPTSHTIPLIPYLSLHTAHHISCHSLSLCMLFGNQPAEFHWGMGSAAKSASHWVLSPKMSFHLHWLTPVNQASQKSHGGVGCFYPAAQHISCYHYRNHPCFHATLTSLHE